MYKAIFTDLDGTLLDDKKNVSKENIEAIEKAIEKGAFVCVCSGRQIDITRTFKNNAHASNYMICSNGAIIYDDLSHEVLFASTVDQGFCKEVYEYVENNGMTARFDTRHGRFVNNNNYNVSTEVLITEGIDEFLLENEVIQVSIAGDSFEKIDLAVQDLDIQNRATVKVENRYHTTLPIEYYCINCINKNVSKGNAISGLCKYLKIDMKDVIGIGDELNDISMIEMAGLGVAMENALDEVKAVANEVTKTNTENGVAHIINKYILN